MGSVRQGNGADPGGEGGSSNGAGPGRDGVATAVADEVEAAADTAETGEDTAAAQSETAATGEEPTTFAELGLSPALLDALRRAGYERPTEIQRRAVPPALEGRDILGSAQTGTGKTAAFALPMLQRLAAAGPSAQGTLRGLVVTPTRELARQVERAVGVYGATSSVEPLVVHGGTPLGPEIRDLSWGCDILVATPGRLLDHVRRGTADLSRVEVLVLDEADRMLDMGFIDDVRKIAAATPDDRQTLLFSATMPNPILSLAHQLMRDPVRVKVGLETAAEGVHEVVHPVDWEEKHKLLLHLLEEDRSGGQILVFTRRRDTAAYLAQFLGGRDLSVDDLHGGKSQDQRTRSLERFRAGETRILVATNVAARGLDIRGIRHVINFDVPDDPRVYVHRVGRTARAEEEGDAITLMSPNDWLLVRDIERLTGDSIRRAEVRGFEPSSQPPAPAGEDEEERRERRPSGLTRGIRRR